MRASIADAVMIHGYLAVEMAYNLPIYLAVEMAHNIFKLYLTFAN
jgi:hypothetical protein